MKCKQFDTKKLNDQKVAKRTKISKPSLAATSDNHTE